MLTNKKYSGKIPLVVGAAVVAAVLMVLLPLAGCKTEVDPVDPPAKYTVKFDRGDNSEYTANLPADITVDSGAKLTAEQLAPLGGTENWIFDGWYDGETKAVGGEYAVTKDVTLVARWRDRGTVASVTFSPAAGSQVDHNGTVTLTSEEGATVRYTVNGGVEQTGTSPVTVSVTGATTITAHATKEGLKPSAETTASYTLKQYTVTFNTNGGSAVASQTVESGKSATRPETDPTLEGSWFLGWYGDSGLATEYDFAAPVTADTTVYAKWSYKLHATPTKLTDYTGTASATSVPAVADAVYVAFGDWPQTVMAPGVTVDDTKSKTMGGLTYCLGSDGNHYVKQEEEAYTNYTYSDGSAVGLYGTTTRWFKVEPVVWRVLTADYNSTGKALLLAESILTGGIKWADSSNNYQNSNIRKWLNGNSGTAAQSDYAGGSGFLQSAFTAAAQALIAATSVDNSAASTNPADDPTQWDSGMNDYACANTSDKVFLLSSKEATDSSYGFAAYNNIKDGNTRIRVTTDYAKATGTLQNSSANNKGDWWLRSPHYLNDTSARSVASFALASEDHYASVSITSVGVVPALCVQLQ